MFRLPLSCLISRFSFGLVLAFAPVAAYAIDISWHEGEPSQALLLPDSGKEAAVFALAFKGTDYRYGGNTPETGMDCSGFVGYVFREAFDVSLPRTSAEIEQAGMPVETSDLAPGDLVFFNTLGAPYSHVGIYLGNHRFIHAPRSGAQIRVENMRTLYWTRRFEGARRIGVS